MFTVCKSVNAGLKLPYFVIVPNSAPKSLNVSTHCFETQYSAQKSELGGHFGTARLCF